LWIFACRTNKKIGVVIFGKRGVLGKSGIALGNLRFVDVACPNQTIICVEFNTHNIVIMVPVYPKF